MGLGFSMDKEHGGKSVIDRLMKNRDCPSKQFEFSITGIYIYVRWWGKFKFL